MTDVWFYHLEAQPLERVLPLLLQRSLDRGWRVCVQAAGSERLQVLDQSLWTADPASFLPHGLVSDGPPGDQPILLLDTADNPNGAALRVLIDGAEALPALAQADYQRVVLLFDGNDGDAVRDARRQWTALKGAGHAVTYWQQNEDGGWNKRG